MSISGENYLDELDPDANYYDSHIGESPVFPLIMMLTNSHQEIQQC